jgi:general secretion pathway protein A
MYHSYFGLQEEPFSIAVNPRYLFMSARHRDALAHLLYGVGGGGGFILLTGEVGTGKTTINRCLLEQLPEQTDIAIILNPALNAVELLASVCDELGIEYDATLYSLKTLTDKLHDFLLENHRRGRNTVLLIDEAQHLQFDVLEQIRLLTNLETNTKKLLQIVLIGQPELAAILAKPELRQLNQRITARYELQPLNLSETDAYIRHRLQVAGLPANQEIFPPRVVRAVHRATRGIPRLINVLCGRMLLGTYGQNKPRVDMSILRQAEAEVMGETPGHSLRQYGRPALVIGTVLLAMTLLVAYFGQDQPVPELAAMSPGLDLTGAARKSALQPDALQPRQAREESSSNPWYSRRVLGLAALAEFLGIKGANGEEGCISLQAIGWRCESLDVQSWDELAEFDRPALLTLVTSERFSVYTAMIGMSGNIAVLLHQGQEVEISLAELGGLWRGEFLFLWQPPPDYSGPVSRGDSGPVVAWLAREFARLDGQPKPLTGSTFNAELDTRVRMFQRQFNLRDDGVVGLKTLLKLEQARGAAPALLHSAARVANAGAL